MLSIQNIFCFLSIFLSGLIAGLLFGYSCSVTLGLKALANQEYLKAMQSINLAIQNPIFLASFLSLLGILPLTSFLLFKNQAHTSAFLLLLASLIYFIGVFGITIFYNVPLNQNLARFAISTSSVHEISKMRLSFEKPWNYYHNFRTIASIISFGLTILAIFKSKFLS